MDKTLCTLIAVRVYTALISVYPNEYRARFGDEMRQTFQDQCREIERLAGSPFIRSVCWAALWMRTLFDWLTSVIREHLTLANSTAGLLEAPPDAPLPWKGVLLVLLPGLVFFVGQVGQLTGVEWFFVLRYRGGYFMIIPVLIVWIWKRRFPIWGLMPLGLLFKTVVELLYQSYWLDRVRIGLLKIVNIIFPDPSSSFPVLIMRKTALLDLNYSEVRLWMTFLAFVVSFILIGYFQRKGRCKPPVFWWLGGYILFGVLITAAISWEGIWGLFPNSPANVPFDDAWKYLMDNFGYNFYYFGMFLLLLVLGALFSERHGRLAMLFPMGYLLSTIIYGRISTEWPVGDPDVFQFMVVVAILALSYRFLVALAGPMWIVRSASSGQRRRAGVISMAILLLIQVGFGIWLISSAGDSPYLWQVLLVQLKWPVTFLIGMGLMLTLYQDRPNRVIISNEAREMATKTAPSE